MKATRSMTFGMKAEIINFTGWRINMASLYEITMEYKLIENKLSEMNLDEQTVADTLEGASGDFEEKAINIAKYIKNLEAQALSIKTAREEMSLREKAIEKKAAAVKEYLKVNMQACGKIKIESPYFALTLKKNPSAVVIDDAGAIPQELYVYPDAPAPYPDKKAIGDRLKAGEEINGAHLEQAERLEIK